MAARNLVCLGFGFTAQALARALTAEPWTITGTTRKQNSAATGSVRMVQWPGSDLSPVLAQATHIVSSVPPRAGADPALDLIRSHLGRMPRLEWVGLLSTTGVYGDHGGDWVDEDTPLVMREHRGGMRAAQDADWMALYRDHDLPLHRFRLAGIYGPGRSALDKVRDGTARRIVKPGQVFSRIHVADIVQVLRASFAQPSPGRAYNLADDLPGPPQDVIAYAAELLGKPVPPDIAFETADLSPMARSFYSDNKRVRNTRIKQELGVTLLYPDYRAGLNAILADEAAGAP